MVIAVTFINITNNHDKQTSWAMNGLAHEDD